MYKPVNSINRKLYSVCISTLLLILVLGSFAPLMAKSRQTQVLTYSAGNRVTAQLSDYSLTNYGFSNGSYQGTFCSTLTNTSQLSSSRFPIFISGIGFEPNSNPQNNFFVSSSSLFQNLEEITFLNFLANPNNYLPIEAPPNLSVTLIASGYVGNIIEYVPANGISANESQSFCLTLTNSSPFTLNDVIDKFAVLFDVGDLNTNLYLFNGGANKSNYSKAFLYIKSLTTNQVCFNLINQGTQIITGIGFDLPDERGPFELISIDPSPQSGNQRFVFSNSPGKVPGNITNIGILDFGFITGQNIAGGSNKFGIPSGASSSTFCVRGNFSGLYPGEIANGTIIRFQGDWSTNFKGVPLDPTGKSLSAAVASNPL